MFIWQIIRCYWSSAFDAGGIYILAFKARAAFVAVHSFQGDFTIVPAYSHQTKTKTSKTIKTLNIITEINAIIYNSP